MSKTISRPRCIGCEFRYTHLDAKPQMLGGTLLQFGNTYCKVKKKVRMFRPRDPKIYVPSWCPRLKVPAEFRVYAYKDVNTWFLNRDLDPKYPPSGHQCAVRVSGVVELSAEAFWEQLEENPPSKLLGVTVHNGGIIEIDDGVKPYFFHVKSMGVAHLPYFRAEDARRNTYQGGLNE